MLQEGKGVEEHGYALRAAGREDVCEVVQQAGEEDRPWVIMQLCEAPDDTGDFSAAALCSLRFKLGEEPTYETRELGMLGPQELKLLLLVLMGAAAA